MCRKCLEKSLRNVESKCPWCRLIFNRNSSVYKTNFQLLDFVQEDSQWEKCPHHHHEKMKLVCRQDKRKICPYCAIESECKNHDLTDLLQLKPTSDARLNDLKDHFSQAKKTMEAYDKVISQNRAMFQDLVCENFDKQTYELQKAKAKILMKFNSTLSNEQVEVNNAFGENSCLRRDFQAKINDHTNFLKAKDPFSVMGEDLSMLKNRMRSFTSRGQEVLKSEQQLSEIVPLVQNGLDHIFSGLNQEDFQEVIDEGIVDIPVIQRELKDIEELSLQVDGLHVKFSKKNEKNLVFFPDKGWESAENIKLDYGKVKKSEGIQINLQAIEWNECNLRALELVLSVQAKTSEVHFVRMEDPLVQKMEMMSRVFSILFKKPQDINELTIFLPANNDFVMFINAVLPQLSSVKKLKVSSVARRISQENLDDFAQNLLLLAPNLEDLPLDLSGSSFPVLSLPFTMPKVKKVSLNVCGIPDFDDILFSKIAHNPSLSIPQIEALEIDVSGTSVTLSCIQAMKEKIRRIRVPARLVLNKSQETVESSPVAQRRLRTIAEGRRDLELFIWIPGMKPIMVVWDSETHVSL